MTRLWPLLTHITPCLSSAADRKYLEFIQRTRMSWAVHTMEPYTAPTMPLCSRQMSVLKERALQGAGGQWRAVCRGLISFLIAGYISLVLCISRSTNGSLVLCTGFNYFRFPKSLFLVLFHFPFNTFINATTTLSL